MGTLEKRNSQMKASFSVDNLIQLIAYIFFRFVLICYNGIDFGKAEKLLFLTMGGFYFPNFPYSVPLE
jgi:hypothetical protein